MIDQDIYKELGQYLYNIAPNVEENINVFYIRRKESDLETTMWMGDSYQGQKTIDIRRSRDEIDWNMKLVNDLHDFFQRNNWGDWNMFHFKVL